MKQKLPSGVAQEYLRNWLPLALVKQYAKFGLVGLTATLTHVGVFVMIMEFHETPALMANVSAYGVAVFVSYLGNYKWTFAAASRKTGSFPRFVMVSLLGLGLNSLAVWVVVELLGLHYVYVMPLMLFVVPVIVFILSRQWAFR